MTDGDGRPPGPEFPRRLAAEAIGTFALAFVAAGADTMARVSDGAMTAGARAVAPGLLVAVMIYASATSPGPISTRPCPSRSR